MKHANITKNQSYSITAHLPQFADNDLNRIEHIGADAIAEARYFRTGLRDLSHGTLKPVRDKVRRVCDLIDKDRVLTDDFQHHATELLVALAALNVQDSEANALDFTLRMLFSSLTGSHRVSDLLSAERAVGRYRGLSF